MSRFHEHLDECEHCMDQPFDLCPIGKELLEVVLEDMAEGTL